MFAKGIPTFAGNVFEIATTVGALAERLSYYTCTPSVIAVFSVVVASILPYASFPSRSLSKTPRVPCPDLDCYVLGKGSLQSDQHGFERPTIYGEWPTFPSDVGGRVWLHAPPRIRFLRGKVLCKDRR